MATNISVRSILRGIKKPKNGPAIFFHKHAKQYAVCVTILGKQKTFYLGHDIGEAEIRYHKILLEYKDRKLPQPLIMAGGNMEFGYLANVFLKGIEGEVSPSQHKDLRTTLFAIHSFKQDLKVAQIDQSFVKDLKEHLRQKTHPIRKRIGLSNRTINKYLQHLQRILKWGIEKKYLRHEDVSLTSIKNEPVKKVPPRFFSHEEIKRILDCEKQLMAESSCKKQLKSSTIPQTFAMIRFMLSTGRRIQEVVHLKKHDIKLNLEYYEIKKDKTEKSNPVPKIFYFNDFAINAIMPYYQIRNDDEYIFQNQKGKFLTPGAAGDRIKRIFKRAKITGVCAKEFRHTFASHLLMSGERLEEVRDHLGHTDIRTTQIYAHLSNVHLRKSINSLKIPALEEVKCTTNAEQQVSSS
ncbi:MAG: hypothetical protein E3K40_10460 [Candidatus Brocadia sp.]|nr:hypothetical protein [Candidatus Brocadia sp.]